MKTKIFEAPTLQQMFDNARKEGYKVANLKETYRLTKSGEIPDQWYDTSTVYFEGEIRDGKKKELTNLKSLYAKNGRVVILYFQDGGVLGVRGLAYGGHGVGVKE